MCEWFNLCVCLCGWCSHRAVCVVISFISCVDEVLCMRTAKFITDVYLNIACLIVVSLIEITFPFVTAVACYITIEAECVAWHAMPSCIVENKSISLVSLLLSLSLVFFFSFYFSFSPFVCLIRNQKILYLMSLMKMRIQW